MQRPRPLHHLFLVVAVLAAAPPAVGGGFEYGTDNGAESVARGGASTAVSGMPSMYTNVAGIADTERASVVLGANLVFRHVWFRREGFEPVEDGAPPFPGPMVAAAVRLTDWLVLGLGAFGPAAVGVAQVDQGTVESPSPARYLLTDMRLAWVWPTLALAVRPPGLPGLRVGMAFQPAFAYVYLRTFAGTLGVDRPETDVAAELEAWDPFVPAWQMGFLYRIGPRVEIGLAARITDSAVAEGEATAVARPFDREDPQRSAPARATFETGLPFMVVRAGVRYVHPRVTAAPDEGDPPPIAGPPHRTELFDVELDFVYETGSSLGDMTLTVEEPVDLGDFGEVALSPLVVPHGWVDSYGVRAGGSVHLLDGALTLSAGLFWQSETVPEAYTHFDVTSWMSVGVGGGVTYRVAWFELSAAYQHIFMPDRHVGLDEGRIMPLRASAARGTFDEPAINAGEWRASLDVLSVSLAARL